MYNDQRAKFDTASSMLATLRYCAVGWRRKLILALEVAERLPSAGSSTHPKGLGPKEGGLNIGQHEGLNI